MRIATPQRIDKWLEGPWGAARPHAGDVLGFSPDQFLPGRLAECRQGRGCDTANVPLRVPKSLDERLDSTRVTQTRERIGCGTLDAGMAIPKRLDERLHRARVSQFAQCFGCRSSSVLMATPQRLDERLDSTRAAARPQAGNVLGFSSDQFLPDRLAECRQRLSSDTANAPLRVPKGLDEGLDSTRVSQLTQCKSRGTADLCAAVAQGVH